MWPIVTDRVAWSVSREPCKNGWTDRDAIWAVDSRGPKEPCIRWGSRSLRVKGQFWGKDMPADLSPLAAANALVYHRRCGGIIAHGGQVHLSPWGCRGLVNMIQLSVCGSDAACCQVTLTTCYFIYRETRLTRGDRTAALVLLLTLALFMLLLERVAAADAGCSFCTSSISSLTITYTALTATVRST